MKILTIAHQKGGVGKTTLALNIAHCLSEGLQVGVIDTDVQGSMSEITKFIRGIDVLPLSVLSATSSLPYDVLIVDTPPYLTKHLISIFELSDYVLIPTKAGYLDVLAVGSTLALYDKAKLKKPSLRGGIVLNMVLSRSVLQGEIKQLLDGYSLKVLSTQIHQRISYTRSPLTNGIFEGSDEKAKTEIVALSQEILNDLI